MPEVRELESFEDFEDAIHNSPTKDCFKPPVCLLMLHRLCYTYGQEVLLPRLCGPDLIRTLRVPKILAFLKIVKVQDCDALYTRMWDM